MRPLITRAVWILSLVSMFTDMASEMLYPVIPVYLRDIGFSVFLIGVLEGLAEFVVGLSKGYFGRQSDRLGLRLPFVRGGYLLSAVAKPMMAVFTHPAWIFLSRSTERLGKGLRTAARDALLARESDTGNRARVFAFHRGWDTAGAIAGPALALYWLDHHPGQYRALFYGAFLPGLLSVLLLLLMKEKKEVRESQPGGFFSYLSYWKEAGTDYRQLVRGLLLFAVANSSDVFLLLRTKVLTGSDSLTLLAYIFYNVVYALSAYPMGMLADRWGMKKIYLGGLLLFALVYAGFAFPVSTTAVFVLFFFYGIYAAATEGISKAWIVDTLRDRKTGTAIGFFTSAQSIAGLLASLLAGALWSLWGPAALFTWSVFLSLTALLYLKKKAGRGAITVH